MKPTGDSNVFIDLSFLSPEEETVIQKVLLRDEDLKKLDTGRVRRLKDSVNDVKELKVLTGEWFEELKVTRYGHQPHASAVVQSSMRWKKTAGHKPNPFPIPVPEDNDAETAETHPGVPVDPRSIHPARSVEICQEFRDEDIILKDAPGLQLSDPEQSQSEAKPKDEPSFIVSSNHEPALETKGVIRSKSKSEDPRSSPQQDNQTNVYAETETPGFNKKHNAGRRNFEIRSFNEALEKSDWYQSRRLDTSPEAEPNKDGGASPTRTDELNLDLEDPDVLPDLQTGSVHDPNTLKQETLDRSVVDPVEKKRSIKKIIITDFRQASEELHVDLKAREDPDILQTGRVHDFRTLKHANLDQDPVEEGRGFDFRRASPTRMDANETEDPDVLLDLHAGPAPTEKVKTTNEIVVTEFRGASPTRKDLNPDLVEDLEVYDLNRPKDVGLDQTIRAVEMERGKITKSAVNNETPGGTTESEILASIYARALRPKPKLNEEDGLIPTIVIISDSEEPEETESAKKGISAPEAPADDRIPANGDTWEGKSGSDSDEGSSASSHESDVLGKKSLSASKLSVTERTGSLLSVYSDAGDFGNVLVQGSVEFAILYSPLGELVIMVEKCQDLAVANLRKQRTDPYVKTYLYPDKKSKRKTSIKKHTVNPVFLESLRVHKWHRGEERTQYKVKHEELPGRTLNLSVWHNDSRGRNVFLGQVEISLRNWDWRHEALTWYTLQPKSKENHESEESNGVLSVALKYVPPESTGGSRLSRATGEIHIWLREARQLRRLKPQGVDSFVKCYMLPDTSKKSRHKTRVVKRSQDPVFNHTMVYDGFRAGEVGEACCELTVWDSNKLSNQFLGGVRLGLGTGLSYGKKVDWMDSENEETEIWKRMLENPNSWVEAELPLRPSMTPRK